jgi:hypothetical protein
MTQHLVSITVYIIKRSLQNREDGMNINGTIINNIRYADDTIILAESVEQLQTVMEIINTGLKLINVKRRLWFLVKL